MLDRVRHYQVTKILIYIINKYKYSKKTLISKLMTFTLNFVFYY